jgi:hypothetical protein
MNCRFQESFSHSKIYVELEQTTTTTPTVNSITTFKAAQFKLAVIDATVDAMST